MSEQDLPGPLGPSDPRVKNYVITSSLLTNPNLDQTRPSAMGRDRQRSPSPRGRNYDEDKSRDTGYERRRRDGSRDHRSSKNRDGRRDDEYDTSRRRRSRDRSRDKSSDEGGSRENSKKCVSMHFSPRSSPLTIRFTDGRETNPRNANLGRQKRRG